MTKTFADQVRETEARHVLQTYKRAPIVLVRGQGPRVWDTEGKDYLDFTSGVGVASLGHANPGLARVVAEQASTLVHTSNLFFHPYQAELSEKLARLSGLDRAFFCNSGTEAMEACLKFARRYWYTKGERQRTGFVALTRAFHGRTFGSLSVTADPHYREPFEPLVPGVTFVDPGDTDALAAAVTDRTAAVVVEPIQGEGGIRPASQEFMKGLRALCDEHDLMLVLDEVQCGVARTGKLYAHEHYGITPDILATAKGIGGGFPLGACLATENAASGMVIGTHGSTFGGNPLAMAAGMAVLDIAATPEFLNHVQQMGERLRAALEQMIPNHDQLFDSVRGMGLMLGVKMKSDSRAFVGYLRERGLLTVAAGDNVFRVLPPLIIEESHIREFVDGLSAAAADYEVPAAA